MLAIESTPLATDKIGIYYLRQIWTSQLAQLTNQKTDAQPIEWKYLVAVFNTLGIGLEPTLQFIMHERPTFLEFENWILKNGVVSKEVISHFNKVINQDSSSKVAEQSTETAVLSEEDLKQWDKEGYVIIRQAISKEDCAATKSVIYDCIDADENDRSTWYRKHPMKQGIMVQLFNSELLNRNRLSKRIQTAYQQLWNRTDLLVSMDRVSFNPPETAEYQFPGPNLHWDVSLKQPIPFGLQGLLYLTDTTVDQGAFTLIPGMHNTIGSWLDGLPPSANPREFDFNSLNPKAIAGNAGDFIIWHQALPHGSSPNRSQQPRIVQYINYQPIEMEKQDEWI